MQYARLRTRGPGVVDDPVLDACAATRDHHIHEFVAVQISVAVWVIAALRVMLHCCTKDRYMGELERGLQACTCTVCYT
jgi:hypothetical protein